VYAFILCAAAVFLECLLHHFVQHHSISNIVCNIQKVHSAQSTQTGPCRLYRSYRTLWTI